MRKTKTFFCTTWWSPRTTRTPRTASFSGTRGRGSSGTSRSSAAAAAREGGDDSAAAATAAAAAAVVDLSLSLSRASTLLSSKKKAATCEFRSRGLPMTSLAVGDTGGVEKGSRESNAIDRSRGHYLSMERGITSRSVRVRVGDRGVPNPNPNRNPDPNPNPNPGCRNDSGRRCCEWITDYETNALPTELRSLKEMTISIFQTLMKRQDVKKRGGEEREKEQEEEVDGTRSRKFHFQLFLPSSLLLLFLLLI